jgi:hypothetical protein
MKTLSVVRLLLRLLFLKQYKDGMKMQAPGRMDLQLVLLFKRNDYAQQYFGS